MHTGFQFRSRDDLGWGRADPKLTEVVEADDWRQITPFCLPEFDNSPGDWYNSVTIGGQGGFV